MKSIIYLKFLIGVFNQTHLCIAWFPGGGMFGLTKATRVPNKTQVPHSQYSLREIPIFAKF